MKHFIFFLTIVFLCPWPFFLLAENQPEVWHRTDSLVLLPSEDTISWTDEYAVFSVLRNLHEDSVQCLWGFAENDTISTAVLTDGLYTSSGGILLMHPTIGISNICIFLNNPLDASTDSKLCSRIRNIFVETVTIRSIKLLYPAE